MSTTNAAEYILTYFPIRGRAEHIRLLLEDCKVAYHQNLIANEDWKQLKARGPETGEIPFGQLPVLQHGNLYLAQSGAIARYLARRHNKYGQSELEMCLADMMYDTVSDIRQVYRDFIFDENWQAKREKFVENAASRFSLLEKYMSRRNTSYLVGKDTTFADYHLLEVIHIIQRVQSDIIRPYSWLESFCRNMESRPNIAEYLKSSRRFEKPVPLPHA